MRKNIIKLGTIALSALAIISLASCAREVIYTAQPERQGGTKPSGQTTTTKKTDPVTPVEDDGGTYNLKVWCAQEDYEMIGSMLASYEELHPKNNYNFKIEKVGEDVAASRLSQDVSAAADVFSFANDQLCSLINIDAISQLPSSYSSQIDDQIDVAQTAAKHNGANYAFPYSYENCFLYYNKSLISDVSSIEGILSASTSATYNLGIDMGDSYYTTMFLYTAGVQIFGPQGIDASNVDLANANAYKACRYIANTLGTNTKLGSVTKGDQYSSLSTGNVAAMISGPHNISLFKAALGSNFGVATLPTIKFQGESNATPLESFSGVKMYGVSKKADKDRSQRETTEAFRVAAFLSNADNQMIRLEEREFCPTNSDLFEEAVESGIDTVKVVVEQSEHAKLKPGLIEMTNYWEPMSSFLLGVYNLNIAEGAWENQLKSIEAKLKKS